jgi:hypothetical protein
MAQLAVLAVMALAAVNKGAQQRKVKYQEAEQLRDVRNRSMAATTANISERERDKERMYSRALAVSAASGAGVDDPGLVSVIGDLNAEGEYRILSELYVGSSEAEGIRVESENAMRAGDAALEASYMTAATTVLSSYGNFGSMLGGFSQSSQMSKGLAAASSEATIPKYLASPPA